MISNMDKCCKDCKWYSSALLVCFHMANEGMRVFSGNQKACKWFNQPQLDNNEDEE